MLLKRLNLDGFARDDPHVFDGIAQALAYVSARQPGLVGSGVAANGNRAPTRPTHGRAFAVTVEPAPAERASRTSRTGRRQILDRVNALRLPFRDLSYRFKIPFSVSVVILVTALIISAVLVVRSYQYLRQDLVTGAESLGKTLSRALLPVMLHDEMWQAYEMSVTPFDKPGDLDNAQKVTLVLDSRADLRCFAPSPVPVHSILCRRGRSAATARLAAIRANRSTHRSWSRMSSRGTSP